MGRPFLQHRDAVRAAVLYAVRYAAWNISLTGVLSVLYRLRIQSRPKVATNFATAAGASCYYTGGCLQKLRHKNQQMRMLLLLSLQCPSSWLSNVPQTIEPEGDLREDGLLPVYHYRDCSRQQEDSLMTLSGGRRGTTNKDAVLNQSEMHSRGCSSG